MIHALDTTILKRTVHISDLCPGVAEDQIRDACGKYGRVVDSVIFRASNHGMFALVEFDSAASADSLWVNTEVNIHGIRFPVSRALRPVRLHDPPSVIYGQYPVLGKSDPMHSRRRFEEMDAEISSRIGHIETRIRRSIHQVNR